MFDLEVIREVERFKRIQHFNFMMQMRDAASSPIRRAIYRVVSQGAQIAMSKSPVWTGTLRAHHRISVTGEGNWVTGRIFIAPGAHPITGTLTTEYGPQVHRREPWFRETFESPAFEEVAREGVRMIYDWIESQKP